MPPSQAVDTVADTEVMLDDLGLPGGVRALTDSCLVSTCMIVLLLLHVVEGR
jgi:hypothetical protein